MKIAPVAGPGLAGPSALFEVNPFGPFRGIRDCSTAADLVVEGGLAAADHAPGIPGYDRGEAKLRAKPERGG